MKSTLYTKKHLVLLLALPLLMACGNGSKNTGKDNKQPLQNSIKIDNALRSRLADFAQKPRPKGNFGFHVYDLTADKPVYGYNENEAQSSASCMKLLSGVAGLRGQRNAKGRSGSATRRARSKDVCRGLATQRH